MINMFDMIGAAVKDWKKDWKIMPVKKCPDCEYNTDEEHVNYCPYCGIRLETILDGKKGIGVE